MKEQAGARELILQCGDGLGNQMFKYAAGLFFARRTGRSLRVLSPLLQHQQWNGFARPFQLSQFQLQNEIGPPSSVDRVFLANRPRMRVAASLLGGVLRRRAIQEPQPYHFSPALLDGNRSVAVYLNGYWQSAGYVAGAAESLREQYRFRTPPTGRNAEYARLIQALACPVSLHLRVGDYATIHNKHSAGGTASMVLRRGYYAAAIARLEQELPGSTLIVFSDDLAKAREILADQPGCIFVEGNDAATAYEDLRLMSLCRHHILANSSFSWWGAWLNSSAEKRVFAPKYWSNTRDSYFPELYPEGWTVVDNLA